MYNTRQANNNASKLTKDQLWEALENCESRINRLKTKIDKATNSQEKLTMMIDLEKLRLERMSFVESLVKR
jgi:predicted component of type VI protein secretion system